jgi:hypothetical protein
MARFTACYVTTPHTWPQKPGGNTKWFRNIVKPVPAQMITRQNPTEREAIDFLPVGTGVPGTEQDSAPTAKSRRLCNTSIQNENPGPSNNLDAETTEATAETRVRADPNTTDPIVNPIAEAIANQSLWDTGDAIQYFGAVDGAVSPKEAVETRIEKLQKGYISSTGWTLVLDDFDQHAEGYWTYDHMVLQFEDCIDAVKVLYPDYDYIFLFDHSCGHDRKQPDGLCANSIRKGFGGKQPEMRDTKIEAEEYLGEFQHDLSLQVGSFQKRVFAPGDVGPFWMTPAARESNRKDGLTGKKVIKSRNMSDLLKDLRAKGVSAKGKKTNCKLFARIRICQ